MADPVLWSTLLLRTTRELRRIEAKLVKLEHVIGEVVRNAQSPRSSHFRELQEFDRVRQEIAGISAFLGALAHRVPADWTADAQSASRTVELEALAAALGRGEPYEVEAGAYEAFD